MSLSSMFIIASLFLSLTLVLSAAHIAHHIRHWRHAPSQQWTIALLTIIPLFAVSAWINLAAPSAAPYTSILQLSLNASAIYFVYRLSLVFLAGPTGVRAWIVHKPPIRPRLMRCIPPIAVTPRLFDRIDALITQSIIVAPIFAVAKTFTDEALHDDVGAHTLATLFSTGALISNILAIIAYLQVIRVLPHELAPFRMISKLFVVKGALIIIAQQRSIIGYFVDSSSSADEVHNFAICIEALLGASMQMRNFDVESFSNGYFTTLIEAREEYAAAWHRQQLEQLQQESSKVVSAIITAPSDLYIDIVPIEQGSKQQIAIPRTPLLARVANRR